MSWRIEHRRIYLAGEERYEIFAFEYGPAYDFVLYGKAVVPFTADAQVIQAACVEAREMLAIEPKVAWA